MDEQKLKLWAEIKHFSYGEFDDPTEKDSGLSMNIEFVKILDAIREDANEPLHIDSGFRTKEHNDQVGGKTDSAHMEGVAADIACSTSELRFKILASAVRRGIKRIGIGTGFIHLDMSFNLPQVVSWLYPQKATATNQKEA